MQEQQQASAEFLEALDIEETMVEQPSEDLLGVIGKLAQRQVTLLGEGLAKGPTGDAIKGISEWVKKNRLEAREELKDYSIAELAATLAARLADYRVVSENLLPDAMAQIGGGVGMKTFTLNNGYIIEVADEVRASMRADMIGKAVDWLEERGLGGIVRDEIKFELGLDDKEKSEALLEFAKEHGIVGNEKLYVHHSTLPAVVKEQRTKGVEFPQDLFSVSDFKKTVIKIPKAVKR